jgi:hypothetical protein
MIFTTNTPVTAWGRILHDEDLAHAIVDRVLERGRLLTLDTEPSTSALTIRPSHHHLRMWPDFSGNARQHFRNPQW